MSRNKERVSWGIPVPNDSQDLIYVWFDALNSYFSSAEKLELLEKLGPHFMLMEPFSMVNIVGKDILKFHSNMWPLMINSLNLEINQSLICHNHWIKDNVFPKSPYTF